MNDSVGRRWLTIMWMSVAAVFPANALADAAYEALKAQVEVLQKQLAAVQEELKRIEQRSAPSEVRGAPGVAARLEKEIEIAGEWRHPNTLVHMAGYADVGYASNADEDGSFNVGSFSPIFHFQYKDLVMLEAELELEVEHDGETEVGLEYLTIDLFLNDSVALVAGKFLSPVGQFRQNLHPSWINKLPSAPPGFGHDGAAPASEMGVQARGGFSLGGVRANYAAYVGNGPELNSVTEDGDFELEGIVAEAFGEDRDGKKVYGGRLGVLPAPGLEIGVSAVTGKATVTTLEDEDTGTDMSLSTEAARDYDVWGVDFSWRKGGLRARGEFVETKVGAASRGLTASPGSTWSSWYVQGAYRIPSTKFEGVLRYTDFDSPHAADSQKQWAVGVNYLFASSVVGKLAYEMNDGLSGSEADEDRWLTQLAYGF